MAVTVNGAFEEFMRDVVSLDPDVTKSARYSRDNLLSNISEFDNRDGFLTFATLLMFISVPLRGGQSVAS